MLDGLRDQLALATARRGALAREIGGVLAPAAVRRVLVVLPEGEEDQRTAWRHLRAIAGGREALLPVVLSENVPYVPDGFVGSVVAVGSKDIGRTGLVRRALREAVWARRPDVGLDLSRTYRLAAAHLVGAAPARFRAGFLPPPDTPLFDEAFYDFLLATGDGFNAALTTLLRYLEAVEPPVLTFGARAEAQPVRG